MRFMPSNITKRPMASSAIDKTIRRFRVYVIRLDSSVLKSAKFRSENPDHVIAMDCYYVGMTAKTAEKRFAQHKAGYKACRFVTRHGLELMPERFSHVHPKTFEEAQRFERRLARRLRRKGHAVWQR